MGAYIISGTLDEEKDDFEHELLVGNEDFDTVLDASHVAIVFDDAVDVSETERIATCLERRADKFRELGFIAT